MNDGTQADAVGARDTIGERLHAVRIGLYGSDGVDALAHKLGIAPQVWRNIEQIGGLITAAQLLAFVELTGANPVWLLRGEGPMYRTGFGPPTDA